MTEWDEPESAGGAEALAEPESAIVRGAGSAGVATAIAAEEAPLAVG